MNFPNRMTEIISIWLKFQPDYWQCIVHESKRRSRELGLFEDEAELLACAHLEGAFREHYYEFLLCGVAPAQHVLLEAALDSVCWEKLAESWVRGELGRHYHSWLGRKSKSKDST